MGRRIAVNVSERFNYWYEHSFNLIEPIESEPGKYYTTFHERDQETGLDYRGARYYDSEMGLFLSVDPLAAEYPSWSPYNYVMGNPVAFIDPDGRMVTGVDPPSKNDNPLMAQVKGYGYAFQQLGKYAKEFIDSWTSQGDGEIQTYGVGYMQEGGGEMATKNESMKGGQYEDLTTFLLYANNAKSYDLSNPLTERDIPTNMVALPQITNKVTDVITSSSDLEDMAGEPTEKGKTDTVKRQDRRSENSEDSILIERTYESNGSGTVKKYREIDEN